MRQEHVLPAGSKKRYRIKRFLVAEKLRRAVNDFSVSGEAHVPVVVR